MGRWAAVQGFKNLYTLEKGIQNYLKEKGDDMWFGSLFVFDARMAVRPGDILVSSSFYLNTDPQQRTSTLLTSMSYRWFDASVNRWCSFPCF